MQGAVYTSRHHGNWKQLVQCHWISVCNSPSLSHTLNCSSIIYALMCCCLLKSPAHLINAWLLWSLKLRALERYSLQTRQTGNQCPEWARQDCLYCLQNSHSSAAVNVGQAQPQAITQTHTHIYIICMDTLSHTHTHTNENSFTPQKDQRNVRGRTGVSLACVGTDETYAVCCVNIDAQSKYNLHTIPQYLLKH